MTILYQWLQEAAKTNGNRQALVYRDNYLSWRGLLHRVNRRAQEFESMKITPGTWIGMMLGNVPDLITLALGISKVGCVIVPMDPLTNAREFDLIMETAPLRAVVTRPRGNNRSGTIYEDKEPDNEEPQIIRRRLQGTLLTCNLLPKPYKTPDYTSPASMVMFTSDSFGDPKGVIKTDENIIAATDNIIDTLSITQDSRILTAVPLSHSYGWDIGFLTMLRTGATMFLEEELSSRRIAKIIRDHKIDILPGTPEIYRELAKLPTAKAHQGDLPKFLSSGSQLSPEIVEDFTSKYETPILSCYHTTETSMISLDTTGKQSSSVGIPIKGIQTKITTATTTKPITGKKGTLWVKGDSVSETAISPDGHSNTAKNQIPIGKTDKQGWLRLGDLGKINKSGQITLLGREDDLVKVEGKRVNLDEIEGCLETFPKVRAAQVEVVSELKTNDVVVATVVIREKCAAEEIIDHCARNLSPHKVPRRIIFSDSI